MRHPFLCYLTTTTQEARIDYYETFASVAKFIGIRIMLARIFPVITRNVYVAVMVCLYFKLTKEYDIHLILTLSWSIISVPSNAKHSR